jgi:hypothetical protein
VTTDADSLALSYTRVIGDRWFNETRLGWLDVAGGQVSENRGDDFAARSGLAGVTADPRDQGYPQVSTAGRFTTMGDPAEFVFRDNENVELYNNTLVSLGDHQLKFGLWGYGLKFRPEIPEAARGSFTFDGRWSGDPFADFLLGYPAGARVGIGRGDEDGRTRWLHAYAQDEWRIGDRLTLNLGLRFERNQQVRTTDNRLSTIDVSVPGGRFVIASDSDGNLDPSAAELIDEIPIPWTTSAALGWDRSLLPDRDKELAPRLSFAWSADHAGKTVVRGGYGMFFNQWAYSVQTALARNLPFFLLKQVDVSGDPIPVLHTADILLAERTGALGGGIMDQEFATEYTHTLSLGLQRELWAATRLEAFWMRSNTEHADNATVRNVPLPGPGPQAPRREVPELSNIRSIRFDGWAQYDAVTAKIDRRYQNGVAFRASYTWSRSIDDASSPGPTEAETNFPQDVRDLRAEEATSSYDHEHRLVASGTYELPFSPAERGWRRLLGAGWRVSAVGVYESGAPFTVNLPFDNANIGAGPAQRPDLVGDPNAGGGSPDRWFDTAAFARPAPFTFGNSPRNAVEGPDYLSVDLSLQKHFDIGAAGRGLELRVDVFNLFNHTNFGQPNRIAFTPDFGRIASARPPRQFQLGLRYDL